MTWKEQVSRQFRFNTAAGVSQSEMAVLVVKYKQLQQQYEAKLQSSLMEIRACAEKASRHMSQLYARIPAMVAILAQAKIDLQVLSEEAR